MHAQLVRMLRMREQQDAPCVPEELSRRRTVQVHVSNVPLNRTAPILEGAVNALIARMVNVQALESLFVLIAPLGGLGMEKV